MTPGAQKGNAELHNERSKVYSKYNYNIVVSTGIFVVHTIQILYIQSLFYVTIVSTVI